MAKLTTPVCALPKQIGTLPELPPLPAVALCRPNFVGMQPTPIQAHAKSAGGAATERPSPSPKASVFEVPSVIAVIFVFERL